MMRTSVSPVKPSVLPKVYEKIGLDERDHMIRKLKEDLILARGKVKQLSILEHYLQNLHQKTNMLLSEKQRQQEQFKIRIETTNRAISQERKGIDNMRNQLKLCHKELADEEGAFHELKRLIDTQAIEIQRTKGDSLYLYSEHQKLLQENFRLKTQFQNSLNDNKRVEATKIDIQSRSNDFNRKIIEVRSYLALLKDQQGVLQQRLRKFEIENNQIGGSIDHRSDNIDHLQQLFAQKHQQIKTQVDQYIQLEHENQRCLQETKHKLNLIRAQSQKSAQLTQIINELEKTRKEQQRVINQVINENGQIEQGCSEYSTDNQKLKRDLVRCQEHLQNLLKHNSYMHNELDKYSRQDEFIINLIRYKRRPTQSSDIHRSIGRY